MARRPRGKRKSRRIMAGGQQKLDRLTRQPLIGSQAIGNQRLDSGVADVLQLLVIGTVHVRVVRARHLRAHRNVKNLIELRVARVPTYFGRHQGIASFNRQKAVNRQRLFLGHDARLKISARPILE